MLEFARPAIVLAVAVVLVAAPALGRKPARAPADPKRVERLVSATVALLPRSAEVVAGVLERLDPKDCSSGQRIHAWLKGELKRDKKVVAEFKSAVERANDADKAQANERLMTEQSGRIEVVMGSIQSRQNDLMEFQMSCPNEFKAVKGLLKTYMPRG